ncbi:MAG: Ig-like domain-containing protein [Pseudomonadota bacterium]
MTDFTIEAESMQLDGYQAQFNSSDASNGGYVQTWGTGSATTTFDAAPGTYSLDLSVFDECDGASSIDIVVNGEVVETIVLDQGQSGNYIYGTLTTVTVDGIELAEGDTLTFVGHRDAGEPARLDKVDFTLTAPAEVDPAPGECVTLLEEDFTADGSYTFIDNDFRLVNGLAETNGCDDGSMVFQEVSLDGFSDGMIEFDICTLGGSFEEWGTQYGDLFTVSLIDQNGNVVVLDSFSGDGASLTSDSTGNQITTAVQTLDYEVPEGVTSFQLVFSSSISAYSEKIGIDNLSITGKADAAPVLDAVDDVINVFETEEDGDVDGNVLANDTNELGPLAVLAVNGETASVGEWIDLAEGGRVRLLENGDLDFDANDEFDALNANEFDQVTFTYQIGEMQEGAPASYECLFFEDQPAGALITDQYVANGVRISSANSNNPVMIFDTNNPTGGDWDLATANLGNVLILSEDRDSDDPDDNAGGGTFIFEFDRPADLESLRFLDTEEPQPEVRLYNEDGDLIATLQGPVTTDNGQETLNINVDGVSRMEVEIQGSGALDNLVYNLPEVPAVILGDEATVTVNIEGLDDPNTAPDAADDAFVTDEETAVSGNILANDSDPEDDPLTVTDVSFGNVGEATSVTTDSGDFTGQLTVGADGSFSFTPDAGLDALPAGAVETVTFSYEISDGNGGTDTATVTVTINGLNEGPLAADDAATTDEASAVSGNVIDNDSDPNGDALTVSDVDFGNVGEAATVSTDSGDFEGSLTINADGSYEFVPGAGLVALPVGATETVTVVYTIDDGNGGADTATLTITIEGVNEGPVAVDDAATTDEATPVSGNILANDSDPNDDPLTVTEVSFGQVGTATSVNTDSGNFSGQLLVLATGFYSFVPDAGLAALPVGATETVTVDYTIDDGNGGTDIATLTITIEGVNEGPVAVDDAATTDEATAVSGTVLDNDSDPNGDALTVSDVDFGAVGEAATVSTDSGNFEGSLTLNADGTYTFVPGAGLVALPVGATETVTVEYTIDDGNGGTDTATLTITIEGVNEGPIAVDDAAVTDEETAITGDLFTNDSDPNGDDLTVTAVTFGDVGATTTVSTDSGNFSGQLTVNANGAFSFAPDANLDALPIGAVETVTFDYTIDDGNGGTDTASVTITINGLNEAPDAADDENSTDEATPVAGNLLDNDDDPNGDDLTVTEVTFGDVGAATAVSTDSGNFTGTLTVNADGSYEFAPGDDLKALALGDVETVSFSYTIDDGNGGTDTANVVITINGLNEDPTATNDLLVTDEETAISGNIVTDDNGNGVDSDPNGDSLTVSSVSFGPVGAATEVTTDSGNFTGTLTVNEDGSYEFVPGAELDTLPLGAQETVTFTYAIDDGNGGGDTASVTIEINGLNEPPVANPDEIMIGSSDEIGTGDGAEEMLNVLDNDGDPNGDAITVVSFEGAAAGTTATVTTQGGRSVDIKINANGSVSFDADGQFADLPSGQVDEFTVDYVIEDIHGDTAASTLTIKVEGEGDSGFGESINIVFLVDASANMFDTTPGVNTGVFLTDDTEKTIETEAFDLTPGDGSIDVNMNPGADAAANTAFDASLLLVEQFRADLADRAPNLDIDLGVASFVNDGDGSSFEFYKNGDSLVFDQSSNITNAFAADDGPDVASFSTLSGAFTAANMFFSESTNDDGSEVTNLVYVLSSGNGFIDAPIDGAEGDEGPAIVEASTLFTGFEATAQMVSFEDIGIFNPFAGALAGIAGVVGAPTAVEAAVALTEDGSLRDFLDAEQTQIGVSLDGGGDDDEGGFGEGDGGFGGDDGGFGL